MRTFAGADRTELGRVLAKLRRSVGVRTVAPGLHVLRPLPVPPGGPIGRRVQTAVLREHVRHTKRQLRLAEPTVSWFSLPVAAPLRGRLGDRGSLLYYQDRYDAFTHVDAPYLRRCLADLADGCDVSIATAVDLAHDLQALGAEPHVVPHGVDAEQFAGVWSAVPPDLAGLERPLVGYVGLVDDYLAFDHLLAVANRLSQGSLVVVGGVNTDVSALRHERIHMLGRRDFASIPSYVAAFDVCLIPFRITRLTMGVNPIKLREYLAAGRPVVSTPMPEVLPYADVVAIADGAETFAEATLRLLAPGADDERVREARRARVRSEGWDAIATRISPLLEEAIEIGSRRHSARVRRPHGGFK